MNEKSLLPVLVPASPASTLVTRFPAAAADLLLCLGVPAALRPSRARVTDQLFRIPLGRSEIMAR